LKSPQLALQFASRSIVVSLGDLRGFGQIVDAKAVKLCLSLYAALDLLVVGFGFEQTTHRQQ
jgi:hypothetical protein